MCDFENSGFGARRILTHGVQRGQLCGVLPLLLKNVTKKITPSFGEEGATMASRRALREAIVLLPDLRATPRFHPPRKERRGAGYGKGEGNGLA